MLRSVCNQLCVLALLAIVGLGAVLSPAQADLVVAAKALTADGTTVAGLAGCHGYDQPASSTGGVCLSWVCGAGGGALLPDAPLALVPSAGHGAPCADPTIGSQLRQPDPDPPRTLLAV